MRRLIATVAGALCCAVVLAAPAASATNPPKTCTATVPNVVGGKVTGRLTSSNVDPSQARFATCKQAKKAMRKVTALELDEARGDVAGFFCRPANGNARGKDTISYVCTFRGADTATFVKLTFKVTYES